MLKKTLSLLVVLMTGFSANVSAEEQEVQNTQQEKKTIELPQWVKNIKFSGYAMLQYQGQDPYQVTKDANGNPVLEKNSSNSFKLRLARFILDGKIGDFDWRAPPSRTPRTPSHRAGAAMLTLSTSSLPLATVPVSAHQVVVISVSSCRATSSPMPMAVASSITRLVSIMVRV